MNLDELQSIRDRERQTSDLQQLRESFYQDVGDYVEQLREERDTAADRADDPFSSPEVRRLTDDIESAEQTVEAIYERRVGKLVKMASFAAADMPVEDDGLTAEERALFEQLVEAIEENRDHVLDVLAGDAESSAPISTSGGGATTETASPEPTTDEEATPGAEPGSRATDEDGVDAASLMGDGPDEGDTDDARDSPDSDPEPAPPSGEEAEPTPPAGRQAADADAAPDSDDRPAPDGGSDTDRQTVRITADIGEIFGVDEREYDLSRDDVVDLPAANAAPLVERDAAEPLD